MMKFTALLLVLALAGATAQPTSIVELLTDSAGELNLTTLFESVGKFDDIVKTLGADFVGTVFAPTDEAFTAALAAADKAGVDVTDEVLKSILMYHVVPGVAAYSSDLTNGQELSTALTNQSLTVSLADGMVMIEGVGSTATVITPNVTIGNAVVHIIDAVLLPIELPASVPAPSSAPSGAPAAVDPLVAALLENDLTFLVTAVQLAGLEGALPGYNGTIFAPTNEAFMAVLTATGINPANITAEQKALLTTVLTYHLVPSAAALSSDLTNGQMLPTLEGKDLTVEIADGTVTIVGVGSSAKVVQADIMAGDAVVHVIDAVLLPVMLGGASPAPAPAPAASTSPGMTTSAPPPPAKSAASSSSALASVAAMAASLVAAALLM